MAFKAFPLLPFSFSNGKFYPLPYPLIFIPFLLKTPFEPLPCTERQNEKQNHPNRPSKAPPSSTWPFAESAFVSCVRRPGCRRPSLVLEAIAGPFGCTLCPVCACRNCDVKIWRIKMATGFEAAEKGVVWIMKSREGWLARLRMWSIEIVWKM